MLIKNYDHLRKLIEYKRLTREFFIKNTTLVAKELLGKLLVRKTENGNIVGKIIEVEAYLGTEDKACHSYNYKKTERTKVMYEKPGTLYVYLIYGIYHCLNVITEPEATPCAVLIRQVSPVDGIELIIENRKIRNRKNFKNLTDGPGKLCMAFNITKDGFNGEDSCVNDSKLFFAHTEKQFDKTVIALKRIGINYAEEDKNKLLRFKLIK